MVRAAAASLILHYNDRKRKGEALSVLSRLINVVEELRLYDAGSSADATLIRWGAELRSKFESDNAHLLLPALRDDEQSARVIQHVRFCFGVLMD